MNWKDRTKDLGSGRNIILSSELKTKSMRIAVHRLIGYGPDQWLMSCYGIDMVQVELESKDINYAKKEAIEIVKHILEKRLRELEE